MERRRISRALSIGVLSCMTAACGADAANGGNPNPVPPAGSNSNSAGASPNSVARTPMPNTGLAGMGAGTAVTPAVPSGAAGSPASAPVVGVPAPAPPPPAAPKLVDPGRDPWQPVARDQIAEVCQLDPDLLDRASEAHGLAWAVVRFGRLCYEGGTDRPAEIYSATKTLGATVIGALIHQSRDIPSSGPGSGPLSDADRMGDWMGSAGSFDLHSDALVAHVLAMVAYNADLAYGSKVFSYDAGGTRELDALNDVATAVMAQAPDRLGNDLEEFFQKFLAEPIGFENTSWSDGAATKRFAISWSASVRDMARLGLLLLNHGSWSGERLVSEEYVYRMTHPSFEDGNTAYGYLTWLSSRSNARSAYSTALSQTATAQCSPAALWPKYPHDHSGAPDCNYMQGGCEQMFDAGVWFAAGLNGQYVQGHPGLDMVVISKEAGNQDTAESVAWNAMRPALVALDPTFKGDEDAFCEAYANNEYAPNLHTGWTPP